MKQYLSVIIFSILFISNLYSQYRKPLAEYDGGKITSEEFKIRYELMPHLSERSLNEEDSKKDFLYSLIAEKLWALEAEQQGFESIDAVSRSLKLLEKMYVRDALFKEEIESKIKVSDKEIAAAKERKNTSLKVNIISSEDSSEIFHLYSQINNQKEFDSLLAIRPEFKGQENSLKISFGDMDEEEIENILFNMAVEEISKPIKTSNGWFMFNVKEIQKLPASGEPEDPFNSVELLIKERRAKKIGEEYLKKLLSGITVNINEDNFYLLAKEIYKIFEEKNQQNLDEKDHYLNEADVVHLIKNLGEPKLQESITREEKMPIKDLLFYIMFEGFKVTEITSEAVQTRLSSSIKYFIQQELIAKEAYRKGYDTSPEVKKEMELWRENYLAQALRNTFYDSVQVSDDEVRTYYSNIMNSNAADMMVNIVEVLTSDLDVVETVLNELNAGKDFKDLAAIYSERESTKNKKGEFGFFPITMYGEIGEKAAELNVGEVYGPLKVAEGYSIFKVTAKKEADTTFQKPFEEIKDQLKQDLISKKLDKKFDDFTARLALKYNLKINESGLADIKTTEVKFFTHRYMGFGGRITAVPFTNPWYEWIDKWKKEAL